MNHDFIITSCDQNGYLFVWQGRSGFRKVPPIRPKTLNPDHIWKYQEAVQAVMERAQVYKNQKAVEAAMRRNMKGWRGGLRYFAKYCTIDDVWLNDTELNYELLCSAQT